MFENEFMSRELDLDELKNVGGADRGKNFINGGTAVVDSDKIDDELFPTSKCQKCNCGKFCQRFNGVNLDICGNCVYSFAPQKDSAILYCTQQKKN